MAKLRILQLDTGFPRPAGDIASADSYLQPPHHRDYPAGICSGYCFYQA